MEKDVKALKVMISQIRGFVVREWMVFKSGYRSGRLSRCDFPRRNKLVKFLPDGFRGLVSVFCNGGGFLSVKECFQ